MNSSVTIEKVAQISGVSAKTVSRVLRHKGSGYSESTRAKVEAVAAQLGYSPNGSARALASSQSFLIALIFDNKNAGYVLELQLGAAHRCRQSGYHLVIKSVGDGVDAVERVRGLLDATRLHGAILAPPLCEDRAVVDLLVSRGVPCVRIAPSADRPSTQSIRIDDRGAARAATRHLLSLGHDRIAFIGGPARGPAAAERRAGFEEAIASSSRPVAAIIRLGDFTFKSGLDHGMELLGHDEGPTAIFAANDEMAFGVIAAANQVRLGIPHDVSVMGFDDSPAARVVRPQLTTVRQPVREMADAAVAQLLAEKAVSPTRLPMEPELVIRGSTGFARSVP
ncbi:LacI family DNA-binding transcriptional regulator [Novosphingobium aquae]|uniref:LacI family DNA-binding transcriptional regulator n=1 Tax=Novosphingobium aquae TaxID=3133435 RepID=A0ABU8SA36_9SPHN